MPTPLFFLPRLQDREDVDTCTADCTNTTSSSPSTRLSSLPSLTSSPAPSTRRLRLYPLTPTRIRSHAPATPPPASPRRGLSTIALVVSPPLTATPITTNTTTTTSPLLPPVFIPLSPTIAKNSSPRNMTSPPRSAAQMYQPSPRRGSTSSPFTQPSSSQQSVAPDQDHEPRPSSRSERLLRDTLRRDESYRPSTSAAATTPRKHSRSYSYTPQSPHAARSPQHPPPLATHASHMSNPAVSQSQSLSTSDDETYRNISGSFLFRSAMNINMPVQRAVSPTPSSTKHSTSGNSKRHSLQHHASPQTLHNHPSAPSHLPHSPPHLSAPLLPNSHSSNATSQPMLHHHPANIPLSPHEQALRARLEHVLAVGRVVSPRELAAEQVFQQHEDLGRRNSSKSSSGKSSKSRSKRNSRSRERGGMRSRNGSVSPTPARLALGLSLGLSREDDAAWKDGEDDEDVAHGKTGEWDNGVSDSGNEVRDENGVRVNVRNGGKNGTATGSSPINSPKPLTVQPAPASASSRRQHPQPPQTPQKLAQHYSPSATKQKLPHTPQRTRSTPNATLSPSPYTLNANHMHPVPNSPYHANSPNFAPRAVNGANVAPNTPSKIPLPASPSPARHSKDGLHMHSRTRSRTTPSSTAGPDLPDGSLTVRKRDKEHDRKMEKSTGDETITKKGKLMTPPPTPPNEKPPPSLPDFTESPVDVSSSAQQSCQTSRSNTSLSLTSTGTSGSSGSGGSGGDVPSHPVTPLDPPAVIVAPTKPSKYLRSHVHHVNHHRRFGSQGDLDCHGEELGIETMKSFNVRRASAQCRLVQGYVSFGDVEGLGGPPSPSPREDQFAGLDDRAQEGDGRKKFGWFGW